MKWCWKIILLFQLMLCFKSYLIWYPCSHIVLFSSIANCICLVISRCLRTAAFGRHFFGHIPRRRFPGLRVLKYLEYGIVRGNVFRTWGNGYPLWRTQYGEGGGGAEWAAFDRGGVSGCPLYRSNFIRRKHNDKYGLITPVSWFVDIFTYYLYLDFWITRC